MTILDNLKDQFRLHPTVATMKNRGPNTDQFMKSGPKEKKKEGAQRILSYHLGVKKSDHQRILEK